MRNLLHVDATVNRPLYQKGDRGPEVKLLQQYLGAIGFSTGSTDGVFGDKTVTAVRNFQRSVGQSPDGYVWLNTFEAIVQQYELRAPPNSPGTSTVTVGAQGDVQQIDQGGESQGDGSQPFPRWALYVGLAAAGAVALYFLTRGAERHAMASYGCDCGDQRRPLEGHARLKTIKTMKFKKRAPKPARFPWRTS